MPYISRLNYLTLELALPLIRVINLSYGTNSLQASEADPLSFAETGRYAHSTLSEWTQLRRRARFGAGIILATAGILVLYTV